MRKITSLLMLLCLFVGTAWGQVYQKLPHARWTVTALNESYVQNSEGGVAFIKDENPDTYYHSDYSNTYEGRSKEKGQDGVQAFMVKLPEVSTFDRITYKGRSNGEANWATKVRIYVYETLPDGLPEDLSTLTYDQKEALLNRETGSLTNPAFENYNDPWANDRQIKTIDFATVQNGQYVLFVADAVNRFNDNDYLACADLSLWQKIDIELNKPYLLKTSFQAEGDTESKNYYLDIANPVGGTISLTEEPTNVYFTLHDGYFHLNSKVDGQGSLGLSTWNAQANSSSPVNWTLTKEEDLWYISQETYYNGGNYLGADPDKRVFVNKPHANALKFNLESVPMASVTVEYYFNNTDELIHTANILFPTTTTDMTIEDVNPLEFYQLNFKDGSETVQFVDGATYKVNCTPNFPFTPMTITDGEFTSDAFYTMTINNNGVRPVVYNGTGNSFVHTKVGTQALTKNNLWAFERVEGKSHVFRIYNMAVGATAMKAISVNDAAVSFTTKDANFTDEFVITKNGANVVFYCNIENGRDLNACVQVFDENTNQSANNGLGVWGDSHRDPGSTFIIAPHSVLSDIYTYPNLGLDEDYKGDEYVRFVDERTPEFLEVVDAYNANKNYETFAAVLDNLPAEVPNHGINLSADKFYQFISYNDMYCKGKAVYSISGCDKTGGKTDYFDRGLFIETTVGERAVPETAFQFITVDGGYKIAHANSDYYFAKMSAFNDMAQPDLPVFNHGTMVLENQRGFANVWSIRGNDNTEKYFHCGTGNNLTIVRQQSPATNDGNLWLIKEIMEIPVKVGAAKWSTLCLPMAVVVPNDPTLKVFYVTGNEGEDLVLQDVAAGTVVAKKQAMLIYSTSNNESDTYNFAVSTEAGTTFDGSILSGSTARRGNFNTETSEYYSLAKINGVVAFYPSVSAKIAANKAYILNTSLTTEQQAKGLYMHFDEATSVEAVDLKNQKETIYYDLNGRRVFYPSNGVFITNTGKKLFIK